MRTLHVVLSLAVALAGFTSATVDAQPTDFASLLRERLGASVQVNEDPRTIIDGTLTQVGADFLCIEHRLQDTGSAVGRCYPIHAVVWSSRDAKAERFIISLH
jgi:hypothetical protein